LLPDIDPGVAVSLLEKEGRTLLDIEDAAIPKEFWCPASIFWEESAARGETKHFCQILCETEELLSVFPYDGLASSFPANVENCGSFFVIKNSSRPAQRRPARNRRPRGRPKKFDWDEIHYDLASLVKRNALPDKKEAAIALLKEMALKRGAEPPSRAALWPKLQHYYDLDGRD
jgi:hypothetical protein